MSYLRKVSLAVAGIVVSVASGSTFADTLSVIKNRGELVCGVHGARAGFSAVDSQGKWHGLDIDTCRAIAAAVLQNSNKTRYVRTTNQTRFPALQAGEVDVLTNNVTVTFGRDTAMGFDFGTTTFYDAQAFMVAKSLKVKSLKDLDGATVCVSPGSTSEKVAADVFRKNGLKFTPVVIEKQQELSAAFFGGRCDVNMQATSGLVAQRAVFAKDPSDWVILPERYSKDPMAAVVRHGDNQWKDIVTWVANAMIEAEELEITSANVKAALSSNDPYVRRFLGATPGIGKALGLDDKWVYRIIEQVGNYGEVYDRNFGSKSALKLDRGLNRLGQDGGLIYTPQFN